MIMGGNKSAWKIAAGEWVMVDAAGLEPATPAM